jgi:Amt family ammonium transporter
MVGLLFNGFFAANYIIGLDGVSTGLINGGWVNHNWKQLYIQFAYIVTCTAYSFVVSAAIAGLINLVPGLNLRASEEAELLGMDDDQLGEFAYYYVELSRDYLAWSTTTEEMEITEGLGGNKMTKEELRLRAVSSRTVGMIDGEITPMTNGHENSGIGGDRHGVAANQEKQAAMAEAKRR